MKTRNKELRTYLPTHERAGQGARVRRTRTSHHTAAHGDTGDACYALIAPHNAFHVACASQLSGAARKKDRHWQPRDADTHSACGSYPNDRVGLGASHGGGCASRKKVSERHLQHFLFLRRPEQAFSCPRNTEQCNFRKFGRSSTVSRRAPSLANTHDWRTPADAMLAPRDSDLFFTPAIFQCSSRYRCFRAPRSSCALGAHNMSQQQTSLIFFPSHTLGVPAAGTARRTSTLGGTEITLRLCTRCRREGRSR